jgi:hypothetical protein
VKSLFFALLLLILTQTMPIPLASVECVTIYGRGVWMERLPLYRAEVPSDWIQKDVQDPNHDTTMPLVEFIIGRAPTDIRLTIHNFPFSTMEGRIPPAAQVLRWRKQLNLYDPINSIATPVSNCGFTGLYFAAMQTPIALLAWSMNMADEHARYLLAHTHAIQPQMAADYTIKAQGPLSALWQHKLEIERFAGSFELIAEIPSR